MATTQIHLSRTAEANSADRVSAANEAIDADPTGALGSFAIHASTSTMSTNVSPQKIAAFADTAHVLDARSFRIHQAGDRDTGLRNFSSGSWSARREAFEDIWTDGRTAIYGALNTGNLGTLGGFGQFCLVIEDPESQATGIAVFPNDSAQTYTEADARVDQASAQDDATAWKDRDSLCVVERQGEAVSTSATQWPQVVCDSDNYLEVVRTGPLPLDLVTAVRVPKAVKHRVDDLKAELAISTAAEQRALKVRDADTADHLNAMNTLRDWTTTMSITIEVH